MHDTRDFTVHISFYEEGTERQLHDVEHRVVPSIGDRVWFSGDGTVGCWEVIAVVWNYPSPNSQSGLRGLLGGMVDILVRPAEGIFR